MGMPIDIDRLRFDAVAPRSGKRSRAPVPHKTTAFVKGPIPLDWIQAASRLPGKCAQVAIALWYLVGLERSGEVRLSHRVLDGFGISRWTYSRGLDRLADAGLVSVVRGAGRSAVVTLLDEPPRPPNTVPPADPTNP